VAFFRSADRVLITGDAVLTINLNSVHDLLAGKHRVSGPPYISIWNWPAAKQSVATLARLKPDVLACGHGRPMTGTEAAAGLASFSESLLPAAIVTPLPQRQGSQDGKGTGDRWPASPACAGALAGHSRRTDDAAPRR
jgi:glyoxylase-like metal-dependent hydrolase (beta-lactamase superfamily II)